MSTPPPSLLPTPISPTKKSIPSTSLPTLSYAKTVGPATGISLDRKPSPPSNPSPSKISVASGIRGPYTRPPRDNHSSEGAKGKGKGKNGINRIKSNSRNISPTGSNSGNSSPKSHFPSSTNGGMDSLGKKLENFVESGKLGMSRSTSLSALAPSFDFNPSASAFFPTSSGIPRPIQKSSTVQDITILAEPVVEDIIKVEPILEVETVEESLMVVEEELEEGEIREEVEIIIPTQAVIVESLPSLVQAEQAPEASLPLLEEEELEEGEIREDIIPVAVVEEIPLEAVAPIEVISIIEAPVVVEESIVEELPVVPEIIEEVVEAEVVVVEAVVEEEVIIPEEEEKIEPSVEVIEVAEVEEEIVVEESVAPVAPVEELSTVEELPIVEELVAEAEVVEQAEIVKEEEVVEEIIVELEMVEVEVEPESIETIVEPVDEISQVAVEAEEIIEEGEVEINNIEAEIVEVVEETQEVVAVVEESIIESVAPDEVSTLEPEIIPAFENEIELVNSSTQTTVPSPLAPALSVELIPSPPSSPSLSPLVLVEEEGEEEKEKEEEKADPPSLTLTIYQTWSTTNWSAKLPAVLASVFINIGLPFLNGVFLGIGDLFAREFIATRLGWGNPFSKNILRTAGKANTGSVGLRAGLDGGSIGSTSRAAVESAAENL